VELSLKVFAGFADGTVLVNRLADAFEAQGDEDADGDDDDVDGKIFEGVSWAFRAVNFHRESGVLV